VALNLFGIFEVTLGGAAMGAAGNLAAKEGSSGAFFNGVLATALATPCTAPYLAVALGWALAQPPTIIVLMFLVMGLGLAAPYVVLSWFPQFLKALPKPGLWMEKFKIAMGFPMLATALWLLTLTAPHFGKTGPLFVGLFLVAVAFAGWVWGEFVQRGTKRRGLAIVISLAALAAGYSWGLESELHWRSPAKLASGNGTIINPPGGIEWQPWSAAGVEKAREEGRPVLVDFTADWCVTCQANKRTSLEIPSVRAKLKEINAVAFLGDYTLEDAAITAELRSFDRAGVPLVLVYPKDAKQPPMVLPALLTPGTVLEALEQAAR
jgi:thiol:disulfide interchange protein DsbD